MEMTKHLILLSLLAIFSFAQGQETEEDESSNVQTYVPSKLLKKGQVDVQLFNNLYTQTLFFDADRNRIETGQRSTYFTTFAQALFGTSKSGRVNWGLDVIFKSVRNDSDPKSSGLKVLLFENSPNTRTAVTAVGPKIKFSPLKKYPDFSIQSAFWIPIAPDLEADVRADPWLDWNRFTSWTQVFYSQQLGRKWQLFYEIDALFRITKPASWYPNNTMKGTVLSTPASLFVNYFSSSKSTIYLMAQYWPSFGVDTGFSFDGDFLQGGIGGKYQLTSHLALELQFSNFFLAKNSGLGRTYNLGVRYIR